MSAFQWTLHDLDTARHRLTDPSLDPEERARLEEIVTNEADLRADAARYATRNGLPC